MNRYPALATPNIDPAAFVAPGAHIVGDVEVGKYASVWFNCMLRGDVRRIVVGAKTNIQDGSVLHGTTNGYPTIVGQGVTVGHGAILHACTIEDYALVGFGARVLDGAVVSTGAMLAAGAVLTGGRIVNPGELWAGSPAKFLRSLSTAERDGIRHSADRYVILAGDYLGKT
jgi:carbonic anhydrase/acetyltransferase-like protein (isoleucine patch superfamily)